MLSALYTIDRLGPITLGELATAEQVRPPTMTDIVVRLEETGLVVRATDASDRRVTRVSATRHGRRLIERIRSRKTAYLASRLRDLSPDERRALRDAVPILARLLEESP